MKFNWKRMLALVMALTLIVSMIPRNAQHAHAEETEEPAVDNGAVVADSYVVGDTATVKGSTAEPTGEIPEGSFWAGPVKSDDYTCGKYEHTHTDACYDTPNVAACPHWIESILLGHPEECTVVDMNDVCTHKWYNFCTNYKEIDGVKYHLKFECVHTHTIDCYVDEAICLYALQGEHTHSEPECYSYTWTLDCYKYTVNFVNDNGDVLQSEILNYGTMPEFKGEIPTKAADAQYTYTFAGWDKEIVAATAEATYTAVYTTDTNEYTVTFVDEDGTELWSGLVAYGETPSCTAPAKEGYRFAGWTPEVSPVTGDETYTATYTKDAAQIGDVTYASLADAIAAVQNGDTIVLLGDCAENVTIKQVSGKSFTIDGAGKTYTGTITVDGNKRSTGKETLTFKNINFVLAGEWRSGILTVKTSSAHNLTIDGCTFTGPDDRQVYGIHLYQSYNVTVKNTTGTKLYDLVYGHQTVDGFVAENITVTDSGMGFMMPYGKNLSFKNVTVNATGAGVGIYNYNASSATFEGCNITGAPAVWLEQKSATNAYTLTFNGSNTLTNYDNGATIEVAGTDAALKVIDNTGLDMTKTSGLAANIGNVYYNTLQRAINAAADGDTVMLANSYTLESDAKSVVTVAGKDITIDLNGMTLTVNANGEKYQRVFYTAADAKLTIKNGTVNATGTDALANMFYNDGEMFIESGNYKLTAVNGGGVFYSNNEALYVYGGNFTQTTNGWMFNTVENGVHVLTVYGGTFNRYFIGGNTVTPQENIYGEVKVADGYVLLDNGNGTWTILKDHAITFVDENGKLIAVVNTADGKLPEAPVVTKEHYTASWNPTIVEATGEATYHLVWVPVNDVNSNGVADEEETITVTVNGEGTVEVTGAIATGDGKYIFDSKNPTVTVIATPVVEENVSKTYVASIAGADLTYGENFVATAAVSVKNGDEIVVAYEEAKFVLDEDGRMFFYVGIETPKYETLYNAVIASPEYNAEFVESVKYLARSAATYQMQVPVIFEYTIPIINYDIKIGGNTVEIDLDDAWLDVGESFKTLTPEELQKKYDTEIQKIKDEIANIDLSDITWSNALEKLSQFNAISDELTALIETISNEAEYLGYHAFGASGVIDENGNAQEILQVIYNNGAMRLVDETIVVTLVDDRIETTIIGGNLTFEYDEFTDEDIMNALVLTDVDGNVIEGALIKHVDLVGTEVGERTYSVYFEGNREYKPATVEFTLTVVKAPSNVEIPNVNVNYGEAYNGEPVVTNKHGEVIDIDTIEFIVGLNIAEFDYDGDGVKGLEGKAQLILTDDLQTILAMVGLEEGVEMNINDLISTLTNTGLLEQWGVSGDMVEALKQALDAINEYVEANNLMISVGGEYPTEAGAYLHGAVTVDKNYETAFGVGYIVIAPAMKQVYLNWNYTDSNGVFSWELLKHVDLGATAYNDAAFTSVNETATNSIHNLFFGIDENGELVFAIQGKGADQKDIEALEATLSNGAYTQLAFTLDLGNELIYAVPAVRAFVIVPGVTNVELVDAEGNALDEFKFTYDNTAKQLYVMVDGELVDCDVYYAGVKTNVNVYEPTTEAPVNAGAYAAVAIYIARNENGEIIGVGGDAAVMYIDLTESAISVTGSTVTYDGNGHTADVVITEGYANADYTLISGNVAFNGSMLDIDVDDIVGTVNIDFPRWLEEKLAGNEFVNGINPAYLTALIKSHSDVIGEYVDVDTLLSIVDKLSENVTITFENGITYTDVGHYYYVGIVTDSDHYPSVDTGLLVIEKADATVTMNDLTMHIGQEMPELTWIVDGMAEGDEFTVVISHNVDVNVAGEYVITATVTDDNYNIVVVDGILTVEPHEAGKTVVENEKAPTCTETGSYDNVVYCTVCGEELSRETIPVDALGHTKETIPAVEPTFDNVGWTEGEKCSVCGETLVAPVEIPKKIAVAQNKETGVRYETLAEAIAEVKNGQTIVILAEELDEDVTIAQKKNLAFTIDGAGVQYTGTITVTGSASTAGLTVQNVNFIVDGYGIYSYEKKVAYNITVEDCTFTGTEGENLDYGMYLRYVNNVTVKDTTGSNLFDLVYGNSSFTGFTAENVTVTDSYNGIWLSYPIGTINFTNVTISRTENTGVGFHNYAKGTVTFTGCEIDKISYGEKGDKALTMIFNDKVNNLAADQDSQYLTIVLNNVDTTVTAIEGLNAVSGVDGYIVVHENGVYYLAKPVAQNVQTGKMYAELSKAIAEVENGETIIMLVDLDEDVTITQKKNVAFTIDGGNHKYYGTMTLTGAGASNVGQALTIQNVNFVVDGYGIYAYAKNNYTRNLTVDGCTFTGVDGGDLDYGIYMRYVYSVTVKNTTGSNLFDLVYGNSAVNGFTAENVTVTDSENGIMLGYVNTTATFKNVTTDVRDDGVIIRNNTSGSVYFEDCNIDNVCYWQINDTKTLKMYFNDATNNLVISEGYEKLTVVLNKVDTTVTCETVGLNVVPGAGLEQYKVRYENGVYFLVAIEYVAEVNGVQYESIQDAVNAANDGDTVTVIADHEVDCDVNPLINISGKAVTIDLNGKTVTANVTDDSVRIVFNVEADGKLTMVDSVGTGSVVANGDGILRYMFRSFGEFSVESGNYVLSGLNGGAMFYSDNSDFTVNGGNFTQLTGGWMFNTTGNGAGNIITVEGGTFNRYFIGGEAMGENKWGEVVLGEGKHLTDNGDGTWTVEVHKVVTQDGYPATCTTDGLTEGKYCEGCGEVLVEQTVIKSEGHKADVPVKENEVAPVDGKLGSYDMVVYCSVCGEELSRESFKDYGDYVCYNVNTEVYYEDLSDALAMVSDANGETIRMLADVTEMAVIVYPGTTLDLNGKTVTATFVVALNGSHVIDATRTGTLVVSQNNIELAKDNKMLPVWNGTGYTFTEVVIVDAAQGMGITWNEETDKVTLKFVTFFRDTAMLAGKISDHDVKIIVRASWTNETGTVDQDFVFSDEHVSEIIAKNGKSAFVLTFNNYSQVSKLKLTAMIITDSGVEYAGTLYEQK